MAATLSPHRHLRSMAEPRLTVVAPPAPHPLTAVFGVRPHRVVLGLIIALLVVVGGALAIGHGALASLAPAVPAATAAAPAVGAAQTVVVQPGDTLWSIARRLQPSGDVRPMVDRLAATYGTAILQPGDRLVVGA